MTGTTEGLAALNDQQPVLRDTFGPSASDTFGPQPEQGLVPGFASDIPSEQVRQIREQIEGILPRYLPVDREALDEAEHDSEFVVLILAGLYQTERKAHATTRAQLAQRDAALAEAEAAIATIHADYATELEDADKWGEEGEVEKLEIKKAVAAECLECIRHALAKAQAQGSGQQGGE